MALPRKRKKLKIKSNETISNTIDEVEEEEELEKPSAAEINAESEDKLDALMAKALDLMEKIERAEKVSGSKARSQNREGLPGRIRIRITLEGRFQELGKTFQGLIENSGNPIGVDLRIPIPAFFWKVPIFMETAKLVIRKLYPVK